RIVRCLDQRLLFGVADERLLIDLAAHDDETNVARAVQFQDIAFRDRAVTAADVVDAAHHRRRFGPAHPHLRAHLVIGPRLVAQDRVRLPVRRPRMRTYRYALAQARAALAGTWRQFERAFDVGEVARQVAPCARIAV